MESLHSFAPNTADLNWSIMVAASIALICLGLIIFYTTKKVPHSQRKQKQLISLLIYFTFTISTGMAVFSWLSSKKMNTVEIYEDRMTTPYGEVVFKNISNVEIYTDNSTIDQSANAISNNSRMLIIEEYSGKSHILSEEIYPINEISKILGELLKEEK